MKYTKYAENCLIVFKKVIGGAISKQCSLVENADSPNEDQDALLAIANK